MLNRNITKFLFIVFWVFLLIQNSTSYAGEYAGDLSALSVFDERITPRDKAIRYAFEHTLEKIKSQNYWRKPSIFISYARPLENNQDGKNIYRCIEGIVGHFRNAGMRVICDIDINRGERLNPFMENINTVDFVAVLFTPDYKKKALNDPGQPGEGIRREVELIFNRFIKNPQINNNFSFYIPIYIPILLNDTHVNSVPNTLNIENRLMHDFTDSLNNNYYDNFLNIIYPLVYKWKNIIGIRNKFNTLRRECLRVHGRLDPIVQYLEESTINEVEPERNRINNHINSFLNPCSHNSAYYILCAVLFSYVCMNYYDNISSFASNTKLDMCSVAAPYLPLSECKETSKCLENIQYGRYVYRKEKKLYDMIISGSEIAYSRLLKMAESDNSIAQGYLSILHDAGTDKLPHLMNEQKSLDFAALSIPCLKKISRGNVQDVKWILEKMLHRGIDRRIETQDLDTLMDILNGQTTDEESYYAASEKEEQSLASNSEKQEIVSLRESSFQFMDGLSAVFETNFSFRNLPKADEFTEFLWHRAIVTFSRNSFSQYKLANLYINGRGVNQNMRKALYWLYASADRGFIRAAFQLARIHHEGMNGVSKSIDEALYWYYYTAERGHDVAQYNLGFFYENGIGVTKNINSSAYWYERAARNGNPEAEYNLARLFHYGIEGHEIDLNRALYLYGLSILHKVKEPKISGARRAISSLRIQTGTITKEENISPK